MSRVINGNISSRNKYPWFCNVITASDQVAVETSTGVTSIGSATYIGGKYVISAASLFTSYLQFTSNIVLSSSTTIPAGFPLYPQFTNVAIANAKNNNIIRMGHISTYDDNISVKDYKIVNLHYHPFYSYDFIEFKEELSSSDFVDTMWSNDLVILELDSIPAIDGFVPISLLPKSLEGTVYYGTETPVVSIGTGVVETSPLDDIEFVDDFPVVIDANQDSIITTTNYYVRDVPLKIISSDNSLWSSDTVVHVNSYPCYQSAYLIKYYTIDQSAGLDLELNLPSSALELTSDIQAFAFDTLLVSSNSEVNTFFTDIQILFNISFNWLYINYDTVIDTTMSKAHEVMGTVPESALTGAMVGHWLNVSLWKLNKIVIQSPFTNLCYAADFGSDLDDIHDNSGLTYGDDGSPLVYLNSSDNEYYLVGIHGKATNEISDYYPNMFASIEKHRDWINTVINSTDTVSKTIEEITVNVADQITNFDAMSVLAAEYTSDLAEVNSDIASSDFSTDTVDASFGISFSSDLHSLSSDYELLLEDIEVFDDVITEWNDEVTEWVSDLMSFQEAVLVCSSDGSNYYQLSSDLLESAESFDSDVANWSSDILEWLSLDFSTDIVDGILVSSDLVSSTSLVIDINSTTVEVADFSSDLLKLNENLSDFTSDLAEFQNSMALLSSDRESLEIIVGPLNRELVEKDASNEIDTYRDADYQLIVSNRDLVFSTSSNYWNGLSELCGINADYGVSLSGNSTITNLDGYYSLKVTTSNDTAIRQSRRYFKPSMIELSGTLASDMTTGFSSKIGWFNSTDGYYFMLNSNGIHTVKLVAGTQYSVSQSNWNINPLSDPDLTNWVTPTSIPQVYDLRVKHLTMLFYIGNEHVIMGLLIDGIPRIVHKFLNTKGNGNFPVRYEINKTISGNTSELRMKDVKIWQPSSENNLTRGHMLTNGRLSKIEVTPSSVNAETALRPIFSMRIKSNHAEAMVQITGLEMLTSVNAQLYWELTLNPDITNTTWEWTLEDELIDSVVDLDNNADVNSGGTILSSGFLNHKGIIEPKLLKDVAFCYDVFGEQDTLVFSVRNLGTSENILFWYKINWVEIF
jgi:hypothetical protein